MSGKSRAKSGLGTVKRDFSSSSLSNPPKSSQEIYWPPTPPPTKLSGQAQRLKDIQDALDSCSTPLTDSRGQNKRPTDSKTQNKRPSPTGPADGPAGKRPRQLPPGWTNDSLSAPTSGFDSSSRRPSSSRTTSSSSSFPSTTAASSTSSLASTKKAKLPAVFLSQEQTQILKLVQEGNSVFYTGSAGTGKSVLLREIIKTLRKKHIKTADAVAITASTGIAACNIGGVTIHSFGGIGLGTESAEDLAKKIRKNKKAMARWLRTKVLIIDEISMVDGDLFDKLARIGSLLRKSVEPFGGIQIIVTGDFFQLPPVTKGMAQVKFAFEAEMWNETVKHTFNLTKVFRQRDQTFVDMLNEMRFGNLSLDSIKKFKELSREIHYEDGMGSTELFPRREDVERSNSTRMARLGSKEENFPATDGGTIKDENQRQKMLSNFMAPQLLKLRAEAQVMLIKNMDDMLVNGSMGRVKRFVDQAAYGTPDDKEGLGNTAGVVGGGPGGAAGMSKKGAGPDTKLYPVVEFSLPHGGKRDVLVLPEMWKVELPDGEIQVSRTQLPIIPAWAMSIHKSQGQTLERVKVDLGKVFEKGQAYVALSRATCLDGLQVLNFDASKVRAHPKVVAWSKTLSIIQEQ